MLFQHMTYMPYDEATAHQFAVGYNSRYVQTWSMAITAGPRSPLAQHVHASAAITAARRCHSTPVPAHPPALTVPCMKLADLSLKSLKPSSLNAALQRSMSALLAALSCSDTPPAALTASATVCAGGQSLALLLLPSAALLPLLLLLLADTAALLLAGKVAANDGKSDRL